MKAQKDNSAVEWLSTEGHCIGANACWTKLEISAPLYDRSYWFSMKYRTSMVFAAQHLHLCYAFYIHSSPSHQLSKYLAFVIIVHSTWKSKNWEVLRYPHLAIYFGSPFGRSPTFHTLTSVGWQKLFSMSENAATFRAVLKFFLLQEYRW